MTIQIRFRGVQRSEGITEYATRRLHQHLSRFGREVSGVVVRIIDLNGPRGGRDKRCQLTITGPRIGSVNLAETHESIHAGLDLAIDRVARSVGRNIERGRPAASKTVRSET
jgi:putative sigma-54 modulation protein